MVSTHKRGAVISTSSFKVFLAPNHRDVAYSSTLRNFTSKANKRNCEAWLIQIIMRKLFFCFFWVCLSVFFSACTSDAERQAEIAKIVESRSTVDLLNDLYIGSDGDIEALARVLNATPSSIERLRKEMSTPTNKFAERVKEVSIYYMQNDQSFSKLRSILDSEYEWYDSVLDFPSHHPYWFWSINIVLILLLAFIAIIVIWPILLELLLFLIVWICSLICSPSAMEDKYVDTINPVIEQLQ